MVEKTLVLLAAGRGSRFGGLKQLHRFRPQGAFLAEYALFDAWEAGFRRFIAVVSSDTHEAFQTLFKERHLEDVARCVLQTDEGIPQIWRNERTKPWGTGQALLTATAFIETSFVIVNGDDFYGREAYQLAADFIDHQPSEVALVAYPLEGTLSPNGSVSRALCTVENNNVLRLDEYACGIRGSKIVGKRKVCSSQVLETPSAGSADTADAIVALDPKQPTSLNFFVLPQTILQPLKTQWEQFLKNVADPKNEEFFLPTAVQAVLKQQRKNLHLLNNIRGQWLGVTYAKDTEVVEKFLTEQTAAGRYPQTFTESFFDGNLNGTKCD